MRTSSSPERRAHGRMGALTINTSGDARRTRSAASQSINHTPSKACSSFKLAQLRVPSYGHSHSIPLPLLFRPKPMPIVGHQLLNANS